MTVATLPRAADDGDRDACAAWLQLLKGGRTVARRLSRTPAVVNRALSAAQDAVGACLTPIMGGGPALLAGYPAMPPLPQPLVIGSYSDIGFVPPLDAMHLRWEDPAERAWTLPLGERLRGTLPARFGLRVRRQAEDSYAVTLLWDSTYRQWFSLRRRELEASALPAVLEALGTPLAGLLDQPLGVPACRAGAA